MQYMLEVNDSEQLIKLCKALSSPARLKIVQLLYEHTKALPPAREQVSYKPSARAAAPQHL